MNKLILLSFVVVLVIMVAPSKGNKAVKSGANKSSYYGRRPHLTSGGSAFIPGSSKRGWDSAYKSSRLIAPIQSDIRRRYRNSFEERRVGCKDEEAIMDDRDKEAIMGAKDEEAIMGAKDEEAKALQ